MQDDQTVPTDTPCARCGFHIGTQPWKSVQGRVYHRKCEATVYPESLPMRSPAPAGKRAEEAARRILNPGQQTIDQEDDPPDEAA